MFAQPQIKRRHHNCLLSHQSYHRLNFAPTYITPLSGRSPSSTADSSFDTFASTYSGFSGSHDAPTIKNSPRRMYPDFSTAKLDCVLSKSGRDVTRRAVDGGDVIEVGTDHKRDLIAPVYQFSRNSHKIEGAIASSTLRERYITKNSQSIESKLAVAKLSVAPENKQPGSRSMNSPTRSDNSSSQTILEPGFAARRVSKSSGVQLRSNDIVGPKITSSRQPNNGLRKFKLGLRRIASFPDYTKRNLQIVSSFCISLVTYQLETWRLLIDFAIDGNQLGPVGENMTSRHEHSFDHMRLFCGLDSLGNDFRSKMMLNDCGPVVNTQPAYNPARKYDYQINRLTSRSTLLDTVVMNRSAADRFGDQQYASTRSADCKPPQYLVGNCVPTHRPELSSTEKVIGHGTLNSPQALASHLCQCSLQQRQFVAPLSSSPDAFSLSDLSATHHQLTHNVRMTLGHTHSSPTTTALVNGPLLSTTTSSIERNPTPASASTNFTSNSSLDFSADEQSNSISATRSQPIECDRRALSLRQQYERHETSCSVDYDHHRYQIRAHSHQHQHNHDHTVARKLTSVPGPQPYIVEPMRQPICRPEFARLEERPLGMGSDSDLSSMHRNHVKLMTGGRSLHVHHRTQPSRNNRNLLRVRDVGCSLDDDPTDRIHLRTDSDCSTTSRFKTRETRDTLLCQSPSTENSRSTTIKKSSTSRVSLAGARRRLGFRKRGIESLSIHRSEEVLPIDQHRLFSSTSGSEAEHELSRTDQKLTDPRVCFIDGLGIGQIASRQALVSPYLGDIQLSLSDRRGMLEVEVIRARRLQPKPGAKRLPYPYVKVYLMRNKKCIAKFKTQQAKETFEPLYQQLFVFRDDYRDCVLQVIVWGDYGKRDRKVLMGIVQVHLNDIDISEVVVGWYRLFNAPAMASCVMSSSKMLRQAISSTNLGRDVIIEQSSTESRTS